MKNLLPFILLFGIISFQSKASTDITTATVSGHWTTSGSPYKIFNNITINPGETLTIDPGVDVVFQGFYYINVNGGTLKSAGTASARITYRRNDTTGWSNLYAMNGGWCGLLLNNSNASTFEYCDVRDMKYATDTGYLFLVNYCTLKIKGCNFYSNSMKFDFAGAHGTIALINLQSSTIEMDQTKVYSNHSTMNVIMGTYCDLNIHDCQLYNNNARDTHGLGNLVWTANTIVKFTNNVVHDNSCGDGSLSLQNYGGKTQLVQGNKFYNNFNWDNAAINCFGGRTTIESNYVCNNTDDSGWCGITSGGGAVHVSGFNTGDTFVMVVRNNIIANNRSSFRGAIYVGACNAAIVNNQIVNNYGIGGGAAIYAYESPDKNVYGEEGSNYLIIKNNLIYGNETDAMGPDKEVVAYCDWKTYLTYENNWSANGYAGTIAFNRPDSIIVQGDTTTNLTGTNPGLVAPTTTSSYMESALLANFNLTATSPCIDKGGSSPYAGYYDWLFNHRVAGIRIDIGAYEYGATPFPMGVTPPLTLAETPMSVYPNPATNRLSVSTNEASGTILLVDMTGKVVLEQKVTTTVTSLDLTALPHSMYVAMWEHDGGRTMQKVVVE